MSDVPLYLADVGKVSYRLLSNKDIYRASMIQTNLFTKFLQNLYEYSVSLLAPDRWMHRYRTEFHNLLTRSRYVSQAMDPIQHIVASRI